VGSNLAAPTNLCLPFKWQAKAGASAGGTMYFVYILQSESTGHFYIGHTGHLSGTAVRRAGQSSSH
jgi:hypothetical protein